MSIAEMKKAIMEKVEKMPEVALKQLLEELDEKGKTLDILSHKDNILRENHEVFQKLAQ